MRRRVGMAIGAAALTVLTSACGGSGSAKEGDATFTVGYQDPWTLLPFYVAQDQGLHDGTEVYEFEFQQVQDTPALLTATSRGDIDASMQAVQVLAAHNAASTGDHLKFFAPLLLNSTAIVAAKDSGITAATPDDWETAAASLKGKTIGVGARGGFAEGLVTLVAKGAGLEAGKDFTFATTGFGAAALAALEQGHVDATVQVSFLAKKIEFDGLGSSMVALTSGTGPEVLQNHLGSGLMASEQALEDESALYGDVADILAQARDFIADPANEDAVIEILTENYTEGSREFAELLYGIRNEFVDATLDEAALAKAIEAQAALGFMKEPLPSPAELMWTGAGK